MAPRNSTSLLSSSNLSLVEQERLLERALTELKIQEREVEDALRLVRRKRPLSTSRPAKIEAAV